MFLKNKIDPLLLVALLIAAPGLSVAQEAEPEKWYEKGFDQILNSKIITATRTSSTVKDAPGVVTVYSAKDIQRMGLRSVKELLERTTGFFVNRQLTGATVGSRGNVADPDQFLLLIDGHNMNSIVTKGMGEMFLFPSLEHVSRVEIIRGPGSTLWGSDASLGIIHIITKDGSDINGTRVTANESHSDKARHVNIQTGEAITDDIDVMASFTAVESDGFEATGLGGASLGLGNWDAWKDSYELYAKARVRDFTVKVRAADTKISRPFFDVWVPGKAPGDFFTSEDYPTYNHRTHYYLDITRADALGKKTTLESRFFSDNLKQTQVMVSPRYAPDAVTGYESQSSEENSLGLEMIVRSNYFDQHSLLVGFRAVRTELSPVVENMTYPINTSPADTSGEVNHYVIPDAVDDTRAFFIEDAWAIVPGKFNVVAGVRYDKNTLREDDDIILPRVAANWKINEGFQVKYSYNTGYIRPSVGIGFLQQELYFQDTNPFLPPQRRFGVEKSQEISSHDLQFIFSTEQLFGNLNFYQTNVDNPFQFLYEGKDTDNDTVNDVVAFYVNTNEITTQGVELELAYKPNRFFDVYSSLAYVYKAEIESMTGSAGGIDYDLNNSQLGFAEGTFTPEGRVSAYPHFIAHLGFNYSITENIVGNLHARHWRDMEVRDIVDSTKSVTLDPQTFVDFNIRFNKMFGSDVDASIFVKNLLDNDDSEIYLFLWQNLWSEPGRSAGASLSYKF